MVIENTLPASLIAEQVLARLKQADEDEVILLSKLQRVSDLFKPVYAAKKQNLKSQLCKKPVEISLQDRLLLASVSTYPRF